MSYTTPTTRSDDELITDTIWNTDLVDNIKFLNGAKSCLVYHNADVTVATGSWHSIAFNSEDHDTEGFHDTSTNNTRLTIPTGLGGKYLVVGSLQTSYIAQGQQMRFVLNGNSANMPLPRVVGSDASNYPTQMFGLYNLSSGDYLEFQEYKASGSNYTIKYGLDKTWFGLIRIAE